MGIDNIHFLTNPDAAPNPILQVRGKAAVSRHIVDQGEKRYVFGWDQPLQSFFLQVHDLNINNEDERVVVRLGASPETQMYEVDDLVRMAGRHDLRIKNSEMIQLYAEKDDGL